MKVLAIDYGDARTGIAISDYTGLLVGTTDVIHSRKPDETAREIARLAREHGAQRLVMGFPRNMDGSEGESARHAREFAEKLRQASGLPVVLRDERGTTITAHGYLNTTDVRGKKRKQTVDAVAAVIILQNYLDSTR